MSSFCFRKWMWNVTFTLFSPLIFTYRLGYYLFPHCERQKKITEELTSQLERNFTHRGGCIAGRGHYANVWTRDSFFALFAPIKETAKHTERLANRLRMHMTSNGMVPFTFHEVYYLPALLCNWKCFRKKPEPVYRDEKLGSLVMDANSQYIILVCIAYENLVGADKKRWGIAHDKAVEKALNYYEQFRLSDGLIYEKPFANWEDSLLLEGVVPYTNLLWLEANRRIISSDHPLCKVVDYENKKRSVMEFLINMENPDTVTVSLMVLWYPTELATKKQFERLRQAFKTRRYGIPNRLKKLESDKEFYPLWIIGQSEYHNGWYWSWVGLLWCVALYKKGFTIEARKVFATYRIKYKRYGTIHEVYDHIGIPIKGSLYESEPYFSEGIGMYLYVEKLCEF